MNKCEHCPFFDLEGVTCIGDPALGCDPNAPEASPVPVKGEGVRMPYKEALAKGLISPPPKKGGCGCGGRK